MNNNNNNRPSRPPMTPEQRKAYEARRRAAMQRRAAEQRRIEEKRRRTVLAVITVLTVVVLVSIAAVITAKFLGDAAGKNPATYTFKIGDSREKVAYNDANRGGVLCIDVRSLKDILYLTESSSRTDAVTFTAKSGSRVVFVNGSNIAAVNGQNVSMPVAAVVEDGACSVPLETVSYIFNGISVSVGRSTVTIARNDESIEILAKSRDPLNMIIEFKSDLDKYEEYMNPQGEYRDSFLLLVNKQNPLGESYIPQNLVSLDATYCINESANQLNKYAAEAFTAMLTELWAQTENTYIIGTSGYRSYARQKILFEQNHPGITTPEQAAAQLTDTAFPGYSEHQSGLCIDLIDTRRGGVENYADNGCFTDIRTFEWLKNNAWKFGFVLRYPSDKEDVTGYEYESWHYRYVGRYHAEKMYRSGQTLDQYVASLG